MGLKSYFLNGDFSCRLLINWFMAMFLLLSPGLSIADSTDDLLSEIENNNLVEAEKIANSRMDIDWGRSLPEKNFSHGLRGAGNLFWRALLPEKGEQDLDRRRRNI
ncbi:MAG: hypothetical protein KDD35_00975, partial [Bdellovibrionales bacterium]|nr:hypothetical protein [Bdellovibrionales bacterium]